MGVIRKLRGLTSHSLKAHSLFFWLLVCFLFIIGLLVSFILYSLLFFRNEVKNEIIQYNNLNLIKTTNEYEKEFQLIENAVFSFSLNDQVIQLSGDNFNFVTASELQDSIANLTSNPLLFLDDISIYYPNRHFVLSGKRGMNSKSYFDRYYHSDTYPYQFWLKQFSKKNNSQIFPASLYDKIDPNGQHTERGLFIPVLIFNHMSQKYYMIATINAEQLLKHFHQSVNNDFYILGQNHQIYYKTKALTNTNFPVFSSSHGFVKQGSNYYFYKKGEYTGFTYVNVIPDNTVNKQLRWNINFLLLLLSVILFSLIFSLAFSMRLNQPVKRIVESLHQLNSNLPQPLFVKEFNFINDHINKIIRKNKGYLQTLTKSNTLLRNYAYINKMKNIDDRFNDLKDLISVNRPFRFILFHLVFHNNMHRELEITEERATSYFREFINYVMSETYADSITFQIEGDQLLSIVFMDSSDVLLQQSLQNIKKVIDLDNAYCYLTAAVSSSYKHSTDFHKAYKEVLELVEKRSFDETTQIIVEAPSSSNMILFSALHEKEFEVNLVNANPNIVMELVQRELGGLEKRQANRLEVIEFAKDVFRLVERILYLNKADVSLTDNYKNQLIESNNFVRLRQVLESLIVDASEAIDNTKEKRDHITHFVKEYLENHYHEDITLEMMADHLNITRSYLSTYFKEKTGIYFVDYINSFRIEKVKELLLCSDMKIQEAARQVGYQNINSFNRMFKKFTGQTPSQFRKTRLKQKTS